MATSTPGLNPLQQPEVVQSAYTGRSGRGPLGPVIGVLAVIAILAAIAVLIGRLCSGRGIRGRAQYDFESWVETKCASCIDGRLDGPPPRAAAGPPPEVVSRGTAVQS